MLICPMCEHSFDDCACAAEFYESAETAMLRQEIRRLREIAKCADKVLDSHYEFGRVDGEWADALEDALSPFRPHQTC